LPRSDAVTGEPDKICHSPIGSARQTTSPELLVVAIGRHVLRADRSQVAASSATVLRPGLATCVREIFAWPRHDSTTS